MKFRIAHANINVTDINRSVEFYEKALGLHEVKRKEAQNGSFILVFLADDTNTFNIELTWLRDKEGPYDLGDNESHIAFVTDDFDTAHELHREMGCICYENEAMGIYFIEDPDGYWLEIIPQR
ncbi:MAG: lactoylglutathione lyase [Clostridiaceae bacterium]|jgi:lactoylglutathione lyase|nr:lactoylglutathione lyase [Clostridiaceae bacterium]